MEAKVDSHRNLDLPLMSFSIPDEIAAMKSSEQWSATRRGAKTLLKNNDLRIVLVVLSAGMAIHEHHAEGAISVSVAQGAIRFKAEGKEQVLRDGGLLALAPEVPHEVEALEDCAFVLTVAQPKPAAKAS
jgi:quercetin dioxygenase-like cupin family protein